MAARAPRWHVALDVGSLLLLVLSICAALWFWLPREAPEPEPTPPAYEVVPISVAFRAGGKVRPARPEPVETPAPVVTHTETKPELSLKGIETVPMNRDDYPDDWETISSHIRFERAHGRCECRGECGVDHLDPSDPLADGDDRCQAFHGAAHPETGSRVVLTVAHLDHDTTNNDESNLRAMCQACHLRYDASLHARHAAETRRRQLLEAGQLELFPAQEVED